MLRPQENIVLHFLKKRVKSLGAWKSHGTVFAGCQSYLRTSPAGPLQLQLFLVRDAQIPED